MSTLIGEESERWSLSRAIDALAESARQAGHPGLVWIAGLVYPSLTLGLDLGWDSILTLSVRRFTVSAQGSEALHEALRTLPGVVALALLGVPCLGFVLIPLFRLSVGLARIGPAKAWELARGPHRTPTLRAVWAAGKGLTMSAFGLWFQLALMIGGAMFIGAVPMWALATAIEEEGGGSTVLLGALLSPILLVLMAYVLALSVLNQFALHSLAHNRRGVYSALVHGWRIMRNDGWATVRAVAVDVLLFGTIVLGWKLFTGVSDGIPWAGATLAATLKLLLTGFAGVARAGYWARAYRALGGLSPDDGVPGL